MTCGEMRNMNCELGPLSRPDGSALFTLGESMTLSAVYGPCEVKPQKLLTENATVEVSYKPKTGLSSVTDKLKEATLTNICKTAILSSQHPRTSISVIVQEMQDSGGLLACSINCACLALMNAGIPLKYLFAAVSCMITHDNEIILDPDSKQLKESKASFTIVFDSIDKNVLSSESSGTFTKCEMDAVTSTCCSASTKMFQFYRDIVKKSNMDRLGH
ncbi:hypothetical protein RUM43_007196 [Polyplax serrata]|uniref:Exosome complex component RRP46 n=1 Tax=Polyplax serrata TaxID=468196 RepID=A0AAN8SA50_POLSC